MNIPQNVETAIERLIGKPCCRRRVGRGRSLSVGFGKKVPHQRAKAIDDYYGEWELGSYSSAWRIIRAGLVICGSSDIVESIEELDQILQGVRLGEVVDFEVLSRLDVRINLTDGVLIDFICAAADNDETFHVFGPENLYVRYAPADQWQVGKSNSPWP
jgi:hypothetical protein